MSTSAWLITLMVTVVGLSLLASYGIDCARKSGFANGVTYGACHVPTQWQADVTAFHLLGGQPAPKRIDFSQWPGDMRIALMREELQEIEEAWAGLAKMDVPSRREEAEAEIIDGLVDLTYVTIGAAVAAGVNLQPYWELIAKANLSKCDGSIGPMRFREDGKLLKPLGWKHPDVLALLRQQKAGGA